MAASNKKPPIRFKGFDDPWEQRKLNDLCDLNKGKQLGKKEMLSDGPFYVLNGGQGPSGFTNLFNTVENTISISEGGNSCGFVNLNREKFWSGGHNYTLTCLKINIDFLYYHLKNDEEKIMAMRVGSGLPNIQKQAIIQLLIVYPASAEQEKIGTLFLKIDQIITLHQRKCEKLKNIKKALLSKMFI